ISNRQYRFLHLRHGSRNGCIVHNPAADLMTTLLLLFFPLAAAIIVFLAGHGRAARFALGAAVIEFVFSGFVLWKYLSSGPETLYVFKPWIEYPKVSLHLGIDGLSLILILLTNILTPIIILSA